MVDGYAVPFAGQIVFAETRRIGKGGIEYLTVERGYVGIVEDQDVICLNVDSTKTEIG